MQESKLLGYSTTSLHACGITDFMTRRDELSIARYDAISFRIFHQVTSYDAKISFRNF